MSQTENWVIEPLKRKRGRPKKTENVVKKPKGKRGRPKKVKDDGIVLEQPSVKRKRGRPKKEKPVYDISTLRKTKALQVATDFIERKAELMKKLRSPQSRQRFYDIAENKLVDVLNPSKNKKTYTYIIEAKVRVVED